MVRLNEEPQKDLMVNGLGIESKTYGRVEPSASAVGQQGWQGLGLLFDLYIYIYYIVCI